MTTLGTNSRPPRAPLLAMSGPFLTTSGPVENKAKLAYVKVAKKRAFFENRSTSGE